MIIKADKYNSETVAELMAELRADVDVISTGVDIESVAQHIIMTDTDYDTDVDHVYRE